ncbi:hypothetical protein LguiA_010197 [Lonicera macranthoides]
MTDRQSWGGSGVVKQSKQLAVDSWQLAVGVATGRELPLGITTTWNPAYHNRFNTISVDRQLNHAPRSFQK